MLTDDEFDSILNGDKRIRGTVSWREDEDHSPALHFRIDVESMNGSTMFVHGYYNRTAGTLTYALILKATGRIYALDLGKKHRNPGGTEVGEKHKHQWSERYRDKKVYVPDDITAEISDPVAVWKQFCAEARIRHDGYMEQPIIQEELGL